MPEAATIEFKFFEHVVKGRGFKVVPRKVKLTHKGGLAFLKYVWGSENFYIDHDDARAKLTKSEQKAAFGVTVAEMKLTVADSAPVKNEQGKLSQPKA